MLPICLLSLPILTGCLSDGNRSPVHLLERLGLRVNTELKILICMTCQHAISHEPKAVETHLSSKHLRKGRTLKKYLRDSPIQLEDALSAFDFVAPCKVKEQPDCRAPVLGIKVERGFYCPLLNEKRLPCLYTVGLTSSLETHLTRKHQGDPGRSDLPPLENFPCDYQTLFTGNNRHFFRVRTGLGPETSLGGLQDPYSVFLRQMVHEPSDTYLPEPIKDAELPSLLRATRWNVFLDPYRGNAPDVIALIGFPSSETVKWAVDKDKTVESALVGLPKVCNAWLDKTKIYHSRGYGYVHRILAQYPM